MSDAIERSLARLRREQAERVMPKVGALLDCWDNTPNDEREMLEHDFPHLCCLIRSIRSAVEGYDALVGGSGDRGSSDLQKPTTD